VEKDKYICEQCQNDVKVIKNGEFLKYHCEHCNTFVNVLHVIDDWDDKARDSR